MLVEPVQGYIHGNPKLHKEGALLRAIISGRGHATQGIAEIAESELSAHVEGQPSYVRDTTDFINKVRDLKLPSSTELKPILFCMDVRKLYPSVPRNEGLAACKEALDSRVDPAIPSNEVLKMIELVLDNNNFNVGGSGHFIQVNGTAIGSKLGRNYACTYLGKWEHQLFATSGVKPFLYLRYLDDIFGIWMHGEESLLEFYRLANSLHDQIDLELSHSTTSVEFLDVRVSILGERLSTDVYTNGTGTGRERDGNGTEWSGAKRDGKENRTGTGQTRDGNGMGTGQDWNGTGMGGNGTGTGDGCKNTAMEP